MSPPKCSIYNITTTSQWQLFFSSQPQKVGNKTFKLQLSYVKFNSKSFFPLSFWRKPQAVLFVPVCLAAWTAAGAARPPRRTPGQRRAAPRRGCDGRNGCCHLGRLKHRCKVCKQEMAWSGFFSYDFISYIAVFFHSIYYIVPSALWWFMMYARAWPCEYSIYRF